MADPAEPVPGASLDDDVLRELGGQLEAVNCGGVVELPATGENSENDPAIAGFSETVLYYTAVPDDSALAVVQQGIVLLYDSKLLRGLCERVEADAGEL